MRRVVAIVGKELVALFSSPVAYVALCAVSLAMSVFFFENLRAFNAQIMVLQSQAAFDEMGMGMLPPSVNLFDQVLVPTATQTALVFLAVVPLVTMGMFCEERVRRTDEILWTLPVRRSEVAAGKFLAAFVFLVGVVGTAVLLPVVSVANTNLDPGPMVTVSIGMLLLSFALASIGLLCSSLTDNQLVAALTAFVVSSALFDFGWLMEFTGDRMDKVLTFLSLVRHFESFARGLVPLADIVYFVALSLLAFLLTRAVLRLERIR